MKRKSLRKIVNATSAIIHVPGIMALDSIAVALIFGEYFAITGFAILAVVTIVPGQLIHRSLPNEKLNISETMIAATLSWLISALAGTLPLIITAYSLDRVSADHAFVMGNLHSFIDAFFESVSGFTSTGLSMVDEPSMLPHSMQWWRSFMQWIGGIGIIVFISGFSHPQITPVESHYHKKYESKALPATTLDWKNVWWIYLLFTVIGIGYFLIMGRPLWESINHGLSVISTGGFTITEGSLQSYPHHMFAGIYLLIILGSLNFNLFGELFTRFRWKKFITNSEIRFFFATLLVLVLILLLSNKYISDADTVFQVVTALGTCGFQTTDLTRWDTFPLMFLIIAMFIGGTTNSTTGGIKIFRFLLLVKGSLFNSLFWVYQPRGKFKFKFEHHTFAESTTLKIFRNVATFFILWLIIYMISTLVLLNNVPDGYTFRDVLFETTSALSCVGLSTGITSSTLTIAAKINLILTMLIGRLELIPMVVLISMIMRNFSSTKPYRK